MLKPVFLVLIFIFATACATTSPALIPRKVLFADFEKAHPRISPDGKTLAYLAQEDGRTQLWVRDLESHRESKLKTWNLVDRSGLHTFFWQADSKHLLFQSDKKGDENYHIFQIDIKSSDVLDITPFEKIQARFEAMESQIPDLLLFSANVKNKEIHDLYRIDLKSGSIYLQQENPGNIDDWLIDHNLKVRGALARIPGQVGRHILLLETDGRTWTPLKNFPSRVHIRTVHGFTADNNRLWVTADKGGNTSALLEVNLNTGVSTTLSEDPDFDVDGLLLNPKFKEIDAILFNKEKPEWQFRKDLKGHADFLREKLGGEINVLNQDENSRYWVIEYESDKAPVAYYLYNLVTRQMELLFFNQPQLAKYNLQEMKPVSFNARDGMKIYAYVTLPDNKGITKKLPSAAAPPPMVMLVHGGPWSRDSWGLDHEVQWLANRGYSVMQVNFRGSSGFGTRYELAGRREWGAKMLTDLIDGKNWAVAQGYADKNRVCIFGVSYGGYATQAALTFTPKDFACGISVAGISNLNTFYQTLAPYWRPFMHKWYQDVGDPEKDQDYLKSISPITKASQLESPLMLVHGNNDSRVSKNQSDEMYVELKARHKPVLYLALPDGGHSLWTSRYYSFLTATEEFLAKVLHGESEPAADHSDLWDDLIQ